MFYGVVWTRLEVYIVFYSSEIIKLFCRYIHIFGRSLFFVHFVCNDGLRNFACMCKPCYVSDQVWTSQDYIKIEYVRT